MRPAPKGTALLAPGLGLLFWWAFQFAKHNNVLRAIVPFAEDPYDAVSSFAAIAVVILAFVSLVRSSFPKLSGNTPMYALRTEAAIAFCILVTVAAELVAMARRSSMWVGMPGSGRLLILQIGLASLAAAVLMLIRNGQHRSRSLLLRAALIWTASLLVLGVYPERMILNTTGHILTVVLGAVLLFAPVAALVEAWLPGEPPNAASGPPSGGGIRRHIALAIAAMCGALIGACAYLAEISEGGTLPPIGRVAFVGGVFVFLGMCGIGIGFAFLGHLLGFSVRRNTISG